MEKALPYMGYNSPPSGITYKPLCEDCIIRQVNKEEALKRK